MVDYDGRESPDIVYSHNATNPQVGCYTLQRGFQPSWPWPCCLSETMSFVDSLYELALEHCIRTLGSSRINSMAYQCRPRSAAYCYTLGPDRVKTECLCSQKATTICQHTHTTAECAQPQPPITKDMKTLVTPA